MAHLSELQSHTLNNHYSDRLTSLQNEPACILETQIGSTLLHSLTVAITQVLLLSEPTAERR